MTALVEPLSREERAALKEDAERTLVRLGLLEPILERAAKHDAAAKTELADVHSERDAAEEVLSEILAQERGERLEAEARETAASRHQKVGLARASELQAERVAAAAAVDAAAKAYATVLRAWDLLTTEQEAALRQAGRDSAAARPRPWQIEAGLQFALAEAGMPPAAVRLGAFTGPVALSFARAAPLAQIDPKPIATPEESS